MRIDRLWAKRIAEFYHFKFYLTTKITKNYSNFYFVRSVTFVVQLMAFLAIGLAANPG